MVFGFMKQSQGPINVDSEPGHRLDVPALPAAAAAAAATDAAPTSPLAAVASGERVLAVEDNAAMRRIVVRQLSDLGYRVLEAERGAAALALLERERADLLLTDVIMPGGITGLDLARRRGALAKPPRGTPFRIPGGDDEWPCRSAGGLPDLERTLPQGGSSARAAAGARSGRRQLRAISSRLRP